MAATIRDVARHAGVSPATVSLVLNNKPGIGEDTRRLVLESAAELDYRIPQSPKTLQKRYSGMISFLKIARHGHILNRDHNVFISDYIDGIETAAKEFGYGLEVKNYSSFDPALILSELKETSPAGAVILATELDETDIPLFADLDVPVVFIDASHPFSPFDFVDMDNEGAVHSIVSAFKEMGHRSAGIVKASLETKNFRARKKNFFEAADAYGLKTSAEWVFTADSTFDQAYTDIKKQLEKTATLPTAIFCVCDIIAYGCMKALKERGLRIPEDISVIGFDDLPSSLLTDPPLSSIKVSKRRIGRRAFQLLKRQLDAEKGLPYEKVYIGSELIRRESLGSPNENQEYIENEDSKLWITQY